MSKTAFVFDNGLFVELAARLARDPLFGKVYYYRHYQSPFPRQSYDLIGSGVEGVEMVREFLKFKEKVDVWIFPDVGNEDVQLWLREEGCLVWGMGSVEWLEIDRWKARQWQQSIGLPAPETERVKGTDGLTKRLQGSREEKWIKLSYYRGDMETWHHQKFWKSDLIIQDLAHELGPLKSKTEFIIEEGVDGVEVGYDGFTVNGEFPSLSPWGYEVKDVGFIGRVSKKDEMPSCLTKVNDKLAKLFHENSAIGFFSTEIRVGEAKRPYLIDPCMRCGSPPTEATMEIYKNIGEIILSGADGHCVDPEEEAKYFAIAMIHSDDALHGWVPLDIPKEVLRWVKVKQLAIIDGKHYFIPSDIPIKEIGAVVGFGDSVEQAIEVCKDHAKEIEGQGLEIKVESFGKAQEVIEEGRKAGIEF